ncbi:MAG: hypothetical protein ABJO01_09135 [Parasphingorhabdus sp.]|uniref:hypothetical protein n=1 Tax=Parasphingorhabdus sp. TaxID=2709688 RepID=UPI003299F079
MMKNHCRLFLIAPLALIASQTYAQASDPSAAPKTPAATPQQSASPLLSLDELKQLRGGAQVAINEQTFNAANSGNIIDGDYTAGDVTLSDNSLSSFNGLGNIVINTGAQSALQAGLGVTINVID